MRTLVVTERDCSRTKLTSLIDNAAHSAGLHLLLLSSPSTILVDFRDCKESPREMIFFATLRVLLCDLRG